MSIRCVAWPPNGSLALRLGAALSWLFALGCSDDSYRLGGSVGLCADGADVEIIDRMEDGDGTIDETAGRDGVWFSFNDQMVGCPQAKDETGNDPMVGCQLPAGETFPMSELDPPRSGSHYAARSYGERFTDWGAGIGFELDNQQAYDLSGYAGITFWARRAPDTTPILRFAMTDSATAPRGGQCTENETCSNYFGIDLSLDTSFQRYSMTWEELAQKDWGAPQPTVLKRSEVYGIRFQIEPSQVFDFWIDDVALLCHAK